MDDNGDYIPRRLNDIPKFILWDADVAMIAITMVGVGIVSSMFLICTTIGIAAAWGFSKLKSTKHQAHALHFLFWHMPDFIIKFRCTPPSWMREMIG